MGVNQKISVIGGGFSGLVSAIKLAKEGNRVTLIEKNKTLGGRARSFSSEGFMFDMGPSWYWMPDVFEKFFLSLGKKVEDYYELVRISPSYRIFWEDDTNTDMPTDIHDIYSLFENIEKGSALKLKEFLKDAEYKYNASMSSLVYKPSLSFTEFITLPIIKDFFKLELTTPLEKVIERNFKNEKLRLLLSFPVLFLGAMPNKIPALYSIMNYADMKLGTWYPKGGMNKIVEAFEKLANEYGVEIINDESVDSLEYAGDEISLIKTKGGRKIYADAVVAATDYHHFEQNILDEKFRMYNEAYWNKRTFAPSCLLYYVGVNKKIKKLLHHNLFFDEDLKKHSKEIYDNPQFPDKPLFYVCCPSKTDDTVAPEGCENLFILIPVASGLKDTEEIKSHYFKYVISKIEKHVGEKITESIVYKKAYAPSNFIEDYNAFKGNAYGLANTLTQTAFLKPKMTNKKLKNLFYTGQLTVPGPGVPPAIISGQIVSGLVQNYLSKNKTITYETAI